MAISTQQSKRGEDIDKFFKSRYSFCSVDKKTSLGMPYKSLDLLLWPLPSHKSRMEYAAHSRWLLPSSQDPAAFQWCTMNSLQSITEPAAIEHTPQKYAARSLGYFM